MTGWIVTICCQKGLVQWLVVKQTGAKSGTGTLATYMMYLWSCNIQPYIGIIRCTLLEMPCNSKTADSRAKPIETWIRGYYSNIWMVYLSVLSVIKVIFDIQMLKLGLDTLVT